MVLARTRRGDVSNIAFLLAGLIAGLLALTGVLNAVKGTPVRVVKEFGDGQPAAVDDPEFLEAMELLTHASLAPGHAVEIFTNGDETYPRLWGDLSTARESITMQMYYCEPGRMADMLSDTLIDRARAGVRVLFLYDAFGSSFPKGVSREIERRGHRDRGLPSARRAHGEHDAAPCAHSSRVRRR